MCVCVCSHTHARARDQTHNTHTQTHTYTRTHTHTHTNKHTLTHSHTHTLTNLHTHTLIHTHTQTLTHTKQMQKLLSTQQLNAMKVTSLRDLCKTEGILTTGTKSELKDRLCALPAPSQQLPLGSSVGSKRRRGESSGDQARNRTARRSAAQHTHPIYERESHNTFSSVFS